MTNPPIDTADPTLPTAQPTAVATAPTDPAPTAPTEESPRTIFHIEREKLPGVGEMVKPYRRFFGPKPKGIDLEKVEIEWDSQDPSKGPTELWLVPKGQDMPGSVGSSDRLRDGRIATFCPEKYGTAAEREADGRRPMQKLSWEEHNFVPEDFDEPCP